MRRLLLILWISVGEAEPLKESWPSVVPSVLLLYQSWTFVPSSGSTKEQHTAQWACWEFRWDHCGFSEALEWSSHVASLNGDWTIRTQGQRAAHRRDSGIAQPSLGGPLPWVSGGVAPDQRTARLLRGGGSGWGSASWKGRQGGDEGRPQRRGRGDRRADHSGNNRE